METKAFFDARTSTLTYVVHDPVTRDALVIDPVLDYEALRVRVYGESIELVSKYVQDEGLHLRWILETHAHADHLSGSQHLAERFGAKVAIGRRITEVQAIFKDIFGLADDFPTDGRQFDRLLADGEVLEAGSIPVRVVATPGHTPACVTYHIGDSLFTGDALFMPDYGTGRCDFPAGSAEDLFDSIQRLYRFSDDTATYTGHDYQPNGRALEYRSTIAAHKAGNIHIKATTTRDEYVAFRKKRDATLSPPALLFPSVQVNIDAGRLPPTEKNGRRYLKLPLGLFG